MSIRVVNMRKGGVKATDDECIIDVSRTGSLGNPYPMVNSSDSERLRVIEKYRVYLNGHKQKGTNLWFEIKQIADRVKNGEKIALACWCAPNPCHADVIIKAVNFINNQQIGNK